MKDPKVCPLTGQLFTVDSWEKKLEAKEKAPYFLDLVTHQKYERPFVKLMKKHIIT